MPHRLANSQNVVGAKQTLKAVQNGQVQLIYLALDADGHVIDPIRLECEERGIAIVEVDSMAKLGKACSIEVGAAAASILKPHLARLKGGHT